MDKKLILLAALAFTITVTTQANSAQSVLYQQSEEVTMQIVKDGVSQLEETQVLAGIVTEDAEAEIEDEIALNSEVPQEVLVSNDRPLLKLVDEKKSGELADEKLVTRIGEKLIEKEQQLVQREAVNPPNQREETRLLTQEERKLW